MSSDEQAIRKLVDDWHRATAAGNVDAILSLMSEDVVFLVCGKPPMKGRASFEQGLRSLLTSHRIQSRAEIQELVVSQDLAYCWTNLTVQITRFQGANRLSVREAHYRFSGNNKTYPGY